MRLRRVIQNLYLLISSKTSLLCGREYIVDFSYVYDIINKMNIGHRRQSAVALKCRIRCPSELGLLCVQ